MVKKSTSSTKKKATTKKKTVKKEETSVINSNSGVYLGVALITLLLVSIMMG